jgi:hypothetical protein
MPALQIVRIGHFSTNATLWELAAMCSDGPAGQLYRDRLQARRSSHRVLRVPELLQVFCVFSSRI